MIRGHNGTVAWGRTATDTDNADVYVETVNPANADEVQWNGAWEPLRVFTEEITVRGAAPANGRRSSSAVTGRSSSRTGSTIAPTR